MYFCSVRLREVLKKHASIALVFRDTISYSDDISFEKRSAFPLHYGGNTFIEKDLNKNCLLTDWETLLTNCRSLSVKNVEVSMSTLQLSKN